MGRFVQGEGRRQDYLLPSSLDDYVSEDNPVRAVETRQRRCAVPLISAPSSIKAL